MLKNFLWLILSAVVFTCDYASKQWAFTSLDPYQSEVITSFFSITLAFNKGAAFSFLNSASGWQHLFFISISSIISIVLLVWLYQLKSNEKFQACAISLILGGAWGNLYDRFQYRFVIDFLDFHLGNYHWPIFNLADSAVCIGAVVMLFLTFKEAKKTEQ